ncbi:MAG TPA: hypothetical protein VHA56_12945 [Mucilaginibacter sp.]|nr:hypothetical protein [Mucilaginibacter sp.]
MKFAYKTRILLIVVVILGVFKASFAQQSFDKATFYAVMDSGDLDAIDKQIDILSASSLNNKGGYEGALLMRKAGKVLIPAQKLKYFKSGRIKLETALQADNDNAEFHFLRLTIEEHAPKIVRYHSDIENDKAIVQKKFKGLPETVQRAIIDYCRNSKVLHQEDF